MGGDLTVDSTLGDRLDVHADAARRDHGTERSRRRAQPAPRLSTPPRRVATARAAGVHSGRHDARRPSALRQGRRSPPGTSRGSSAPTPATPTSGPRTRSIAATSRAGRRGSRSPSTCPPSAATARTTRWRRPRSARSACRSTSLDDFDVLFDDIPIEQINTSMTINATAMWLLALYVALAEERGVDPKLLQGTTQNDIIKEYLARGTYIFPPRPSMRLIVDMYEHCLHAASRAGTRRTSARTTCRRRGRRRRRSWPSRSPTPWRCSTRSASAAASRQAEFEQLRRPRLVLRERRHPLRRRDVQDARVRRACGTRSRATATASQNAEVPALPLRRAGELARPHRGAAREQRVAHPDRGARRDAQPRTRAAARSSCRPGTRRSACRGRGTSSGRSASSRSSPTRPTCSSTPTSSTARRSSRRRCAALKRGRRRRDRPRSRRWAARSPRSSRAT